MFPIVSLFYYIIQLAIVGLLAGGIYSLASMGITMIYGVMGVVNFAHGAFLMLGMYCAYWFFTLGGIDPYLSSILVAIIFMSIGYIIQKLLVNRIIGFPAETQFLMTYGILLLVENLALLVWTSDVRSVLTDYTTLTFTLSDFVISFPRLVSFIVSLIISGILYLFLTRTYMGLAIRATAQNRETASILGVNTKFVYSFTFGLGICLAAIAGVLLSTYYPIFPNAGDTFLLISFVVCVLGGLGDYVGAFFGGLTLGLVEAFAGFFIGSQFRQIVYLLVFFFVLLLRPSGLLRKGE